MIIFLKYMFYRINIINKNKNLIILNVKFDHFQYKIYFFINFFNFFIIYLDYYQLILRWLEFFSKKKKKYLFCLKSSSLSYCFLSFHLIHLKKDLDSESIYFFNNIFWFHLYSNQIFSLFLKFRIVQNKSYKKYLYNYIQFI